MKTPLQSKAYSPFKSYFQYSWRFEISEGEGDVSKKIETWTQISENSRITTVINV